MLELIYKFDNPYNSCESVLFCQETKKYYILQPAQNKGEKCLCHCTPSKGYYEADYPVKEGLEVKINNEIFTTLKDGIIRDEEIYNNHQNEEFTLYQLKDKNTTNVNYNWCKDLLLVRLFDYMKKEDFEAIKAKRKDIYRMGNNYIYK